MGESGLQSGVRDKKTEGDIYIEEEGAQKIGKNKMVSFFQAKLLQIQIFYIV